MIEMMEIWLNSGHILKELVRFVDILYVEYEVKEILWATWKNRIEESILKAEMGSFVFLCVEFEIYIRHPSGDVE